jgi:hypothetical protein
MNGPRTPESDFLLALGKRILQPYTALPTARAAMITGSAAEGVSDHYSDLDMTVYEALVSETVALVEKHFPDMDVSVVKKQLGRRRRPWDRIEIKDEA